VLSPYFFAVYIDELITRVNNANVGCHIGYVCTAIFLFADDIILLCPSVDRLLVVCELVLCDLDMRINANKTFCMRVGPRFDADCAAVALSNGTSLNWVNSCRYLGVFIISGKELRYSFDNCKRKLFKSFNAVYSKIGRLASEEVVLSLLNAKCMTSLLYAVESCPLLARDKHSLEFCVNQKF